MIRVLKVRSVPLAVLERLAPQATKETRDQTATLERAAVLVPEAHKVLQESPARVAVLATEVLTAVPTVLKVILSATRRKLPLKSAKSNLTLRKRSGRLLKQHALRQRKSVTRKRKRERRKQKKINASEKKSKRRKKKRRQKRRKRRIRLRPKREKPTRRRRKKKTALLQRKPSTIRTLQMRLIARRPKKRRLKQRPIESRLKRLRRKRQRLKLRRSKLSLLLKLRPLLTSGEQRSLQTRRLKQRQKPPLKPKQRRMPQKPRKRLRQPRKWPRSRRKKLRLRRRLLRLMLLSLSRKSRRQRSNVTKLSRR